MFLIVTAGSCSSRKSEVFRYTLNSWSVNNNHITAVVRREFSETKNSPLYHGERLKCIHRDQVMFVWHLDKLVQGVNNQPNDYLLLDHQSDSDERGDFVTYPLTIFIPYYNGNSAYELNGNTLAVHEAIRNMHSIRKISSHPETIDDGRRINVRNNITHNGKYMYAISKDHDIIIYNIDDLDIFRHVGNTDKYRVFNSIVNDGKTHNSVIVMDDIRSVVGIKDYSKVYAFNLHDDSYSEIIVRDVGYIIDSEYISGDYKFIAYIYGAFNVVDRYGRILFKPMINVSDYADIKWDSINNLLCWIDRGGEWDFKVAKRINVYDCTDMMKSVYSLSFDSVESSFK